MWIEESSKGKRINHVRTEHALETGAEVVGTSCPFCLQMFEDGIRVKEQGGNIVAKDLVGDSGGVVGGVGASQPSLSAPMFSHF